VIMLNTRCEVCAWPAFFLPNFGVYRFKKLRCKNLNALANVLGPQASGVAFKDQKSAGEVLQAMAANRNPPWRGQLRPDVSRSLYIKGEPLMRLFSTPF